jgi:cytochrome c biogenesis protein CcmG/thiol:disulfide interchange protein DsbE
MTNRQQWMVVGGLIAGLVLAVTVASIAFKAELQAVGVGTKAPPFTLDVLGSSESRSLADLKGKVVLLNVWATYCIPCKVEMPSIERLHQRFRDKGLHVVAVSVDRGMSDSAVKVFADELGVTFEMLRDTTDTIKRAYLTTGVPETFVIDRDGVIQQKVIADSEWDSPAHVALIAHLLGIARPDSAGR